MTIYRIGNVEFDPDACEICTEGRFEHLQPQVRNVLMCLVKHQGEVVPKEQLVNEAWNGRLTSDESVTRCISILRKHFADRSERHVIETIPKAGYRLHGPVEFDSAPPAALRDVNTRNTPQGYQIRTVVNLLLTISALLVMVCLLLIIS